MPNHFRGTVPYRRGRERLLASPYWEVEDRIDGLSMVAEFLAPNIDVPGHRMVGLYTQPYPTDPGDLYERLIYTESAPHPLVWVALELTTGSRWEDIYGSGQPWYRLTYRIPEADYQGMVAYLKSELTGWIEPIDLYLSEAEIHRIGDRAGLVQERYQPALPHTESLASFVFGVCRETIEAERADPSNTALWDQILARGLSPNDWQAVVDELALLKERKLASLDREYDPARWQWQTAEMIAKAAQPVTADEFLKRLQG